MSLKRQDEGSIPSQDSGLKDPGCRSSCCGSGVCSLASLSGLSIQHCCICSVGHSLGLDLTPGLETPYASGQPKMNEKERVPALADQHVGTVGLFSWEHTW